MTDLKDVPIKIDLERSIPDHFEEIVARFPDRLAVKTDSQSLTYEELNKAANRVAHGTGGVENAGQRIRRNRKTGASLILTNTAHLSSAAELAVERQRVVNVEGIDSGIETGNPGPPDRFEGYGTILGCCEADPGGYGQRLSVFPCCLNAEWVRSPSPCCSNMGCSFLWRFWGP